MKYLKTYKIFESLDPELESDIRDILLDISDGSKIHTSIQTTSGKSKNYIIFYLPGGFYFEEISECVFRLKDYLGDQIKSCSTLLSKDKVHNPFNRIKLNLDNEQKTIKSLSDEKIENLVIEI